MSGSRLPSENIFQVLPSGFFNLLAGGSNQEIYSECLLLIYDQFEREISYRVERRQIREVLSSFLYDQQISLDLDDEIQKNYSDLANMIKSFLDKILSEQDESEFTDYRRYFKYDMRIRTKRGEEEVEADLSRKQGSAGSARSRAQRQI